MISLKGRKKDVALILNYEKNKFKNTFTTIYICNIITYINCGIFICLFFKNVLKSILKCQKINLYLKIINNFYIKFKKIKLC